MRPILSLQYEYHHFDLEKAINVDNDRSEAKRRGTIMKICERSISSHQRRLIVVIEL